MQKVVNTNNVDKFLRLMDINKRNCLRETGWFIVGKMKHYVAKDTWALHNHCDFEVKDDTLTVFNILHYAPYQEYGTKYQSGTPFFRPAVYNHIAELEAIAVKHFKRGTG